MSKIRSKRIVDVIQYTGDNTQEIEDWLKKLYNTSDVHITFEKYDDHEVMNVFAPPNETPIPYTRNTSWYIRPSDWIMGNNGEIYGTYIDSYIEEFYEFIDNTTQAITLESLGYHLEATDPDDIVKFKYVKGTAVINFYADGDVSKSEVAFGKCRILTTFAPDELIACVKVINQLKGETT